MWPRWLKPHLGVVIVEKLAQGCEFHSTECFPLFSTQTGRTSPNPGSQEPLLSYLMVSGNNLNVNIPVILTFHLFIERFDLGTPLPSAQGTKSETCNFVVHAKNKKSGEVMTPTYPGTYPKDIHCSYKFVGEKIYRLTTRSTIWCPSDQY